MNSIIFPLEFTDRSPGDRDPEIEPHEPPAWAPVQTGELSPPWRTTCQWNDTISRNEKIDLMVQLATCILGSGTAVRSDLRYLVPSIGLDRGHIVQSDIHDYQHAQHESVSMAQLKHLVVHIYNVGVSPQHSMADVPIVTIEMLSGSIHMKLSAAQFQTATGCEPPAHVHLFKVGDDLIAEALTLTGPSGEVGPNDPVSIDFRPYIQ